MPGILSIRAFTIILCLSGFSVTYAQTYNMPASGSVSTCSGNFYDSQGAATNYQNSENRTYTFYPSVAGNKVRMTFTSFSTENGYDALMIYNGNSTAAPLISSGLGAGAAAATCPAGSFRGTGSPGTITSTAADGSLTFVFKSDGTTRAAGWAATVSCIAPVAYGCQWVSMSTGSTSWCPGETRTVSVTVKNVGTATWTNSSPDINVGVKWNADADYFVRVDANGLAPNATQTYNLSVTAPSTAGSNNLTFDVAVEGNCWLGSNVGSCGPGNTSYVSPAQTIKQAAVANAGPDIATCGSTSIGVASAALTIPVTLFSENFDAAATGYINPSLSGWTEAYFSGDGFTFWSIAASCAISGTKSLTMYNAYWGTNCDYDDEDYLQFGAYYGTLINASNYSSIKMNFKWKGVGEADYDFAQVMYSLDGTNWTALPTKYQSQSSVQTVSNLDLSVLNGQSFYIGFAWTNDASTYGSAFTVDDITVTGIPAVSYSWSGPGAFTPSNTVATPTVSVGGTYTMTVSVNGCSTTDQVNVVSGGGSTAPSSVSGAGTFCAGNAITLTAAGGSLAGGAVYEWFTGSCGGTAAGTGSSITVSPTATTNYYVRASAAGGCPASACASGTVTLPAAGTALSNNNESATCVVTENNYIHFYHSSGRLLASINSNGQNLGNVSVTSYVESGPMTVNACGTSSPSQATTVLNRHWVITPQFQPASPVTIRLPFDNPTEFSALASAANSNANASDNVSGIASMKMSKYSGPLNVDNIASNNCTSAGGSGGTVMLSQTGNGDVNTYASGFTGSAKYIQFSINGFSEFWLHGGSGGSPLPVELTNFSASCNEQGVNLNWSTASEMNSDKFTAERSRDLSQWSKVDELDAAGNSNHNIDYAVTDAGAFGGISYYRLIQTDHDGAEKIYGPVSVSCEEENSSMLVFPNPSKGEFTVEISSIENISNAELHLADLTGKVVSMRPVSLVKGKNQVLFQELDLQQGTYIVRLVSANNQIMPVRVVVN